MASNHALRLLLVLEGFLKNVTINTDLFFATIWSMITLMRQLSHILSQLYPSQIEPKGGLGVRDSPRLPAVKLKFVMKAL